MSHGNLEGKLVSRDFWPACENCRFFEVCKIRPHHEAYPHTWHWGHDLVHFPEGELVLKSWVGTVEIGAPHTGCRSYEVDPQHVTEPQARHRRYLALEGERQELDTSLNQWERQGALSPRAEVLYMRQFKRYEEILEAQKATRNEAAKPATIAKKILEKVAGADRERTLRAIQGLASGAYRITVTRLEGNEVAGFVLNGGGREYSVMLTDTLTTCSCPDSMYRRQVCKHQVLLAMYVLQHPQRPSEQERKPDLRLVRVRSEAEEKNWRELAEELYGPAPGPTIRRLPPKPYEELP